MKIIIRPETPSEYNEVDNVIYEAFSGQHGIETGKFMKRHFADERRKDTYIPELSLVAVLENEDEINVSERTFYVSKKGMGFYEEDETNSLRYTQNMGVS